MPTPCPECHHLCEDDARHCSACGARLEPLQLPEVTEIAGAPAAPAAAGGAIWFDDLADDAEDAPPVHLTLRALDAVAPAPAPSPATLLDPPADGLPPVIDMPEGVAVVCDPLAPREDLGAPPVYEEIVLPTRGPTPEQLLEQERAERRAAVRRARLSALAEGVAGRVPEVLVVDQDDGHRAQLVTLLLAFGFGVHSAATPEKALALLEDNVFVAVFADVDLDGAEAGAGIDMCRRVKELADAAPTLLVYVAKSPDPIVRIRAQLAGCDDMIVKPVVRGNVAGVLDMHAIALPADARRT